jgi:hypothetical protein
MDRHTNSEYSKPNLIACFIDWHEHTKFLAWASADKSPYKTNSAYEPGNDAKPAGDCPNNSTGSTNLAAPDQLRSDPEVAASPRVSHLQRNHREADRKTTRLN